MRLLYCTFQTVNTSNCSSYDTLQNDIVDAQNAGGRIIVCGDMNARTAEQDDYTRLADLQDFVDVPEEGAYLGADVPQRSNCDKASTTGTWGEELLELCRSTELLIVNGRTPGDPTGRFTFTSPQGQSVVDYFLVSAQHLSSVADMRVMCDAQYCNLSRDMPYDRELFSLTCHVASVHLVLMHTAHHHNPTLTQNSSMWNHRLMHTSNV